MPPTTDTDSALIVAEPLSVRAVGLLELSYMLQPLRTTLGVPLALISTLAVGSRESTQPVPPLVAATARAPMLTWSDRNTAENRRCCGCWIRTSIAAGLPTRGPEAGGRLT